LTRPLLLDLFCGAGGAGEGYKRAGFDVVGVDHRPQPRYPFEFWQADALEFLGRLVAGGSPGGWVLGDFAAVHASPPCQAYSVATKAWNGRIKRAEHPDLVVPTRELLGAAGLPYVIENVPGAPLLNPVTLCGSSFGLAVRRHRLFESDVPIMAQPCAHHLQATRLYPPTRSDRTAMARVVSVFGAGGGRAKHAGLWAAAMGIDWMLKDELAQAIPPAYTEHIGGYLLAAVNAAVPMGAARPSP
jgi:DNA (cytosine-5)-methyltransferase 1